MSCNLILRNYFYIFSHLQQGHPGKYIFQGSLKVISTKGRRAARTVLYARALLLLDASEQGPKWIVVKVAEALGTTPRSLEHLKKRFVEEGLPAAIERKKRVKLPREIQFGGEFEAHLLALACSDIDWQFRTDDARIKLKRLYLKL